MFYDSINLGNGGDPAGYSNSVALTNSAPSTPNLYQAFGIIGDGRVLDRLRYYCSATSNTDSLTCEIRPMSAAGSVGANGTAVSTVVKTTDLSTTGWQEISGFNLPLQAGVQYYAVFYNSSSLSSASYSIRYHTASMINSFGGTAGHNFCAIRSTDGVSFATSAVSRLAGILWIYADGSTTGIALNAYYGGSNYSRYYLGSVAGCRFRTPDNAGLNMRYLVFQHGSPGGTPAGNVVAQIYAGTALVWQSDPLLAASLMVVNRHLVVPATLTLDRDTVYRAVLTSTGGDLSNCPRMGYYDVEATYPVKATMFREYSLTALVGGVWTDYPNYLPFVWVGLDPDQPFTAPALTRRTAIMMR